MNTNAKLPFIPSWLILLYHVDKVINVKFIVIVPATA